jgi:hypothetical protein
MFTPRLTRQEVRGLYGHHHQVTTDYRARTIFPLNDQFSLAGGQYLRVSFAVQNAIPRLVFINFCAPIMLIFAIGACLAAGNGRVGDGWEGGLPPASHLQQ